MIQSAPRIIALGPVFVVAMTDGDVVQLILYLRLGVQKPRALGRAEPLVAIAAVKITAVGGQIQRDLSRGMGPVNNDHRAVGVCQLGQLFDRGDEPRRRRHVTDQ